MRFFLGLFFHSTFAEKNTNARFAATELRGLSKYPMATCSVPFVVADREQEDFIPFSMKII